MANGHSLWSASATERNWNCPGALALTKDLPEQTSEAADWGTVAHGLAELCFDHQRPAAEYIGVKMKGKKYEFVVDDEMAETAQIYIDYVLGQAKKALKQIGSYDLKKVLQIERRFSLDKINPPFEAGGTADAVIYFAEEKRIEVVDLKGGRGLAVEAKNNGQERSYGVGVALDNPTRVIEYVTTTIVQPRAAHKDGPIRSETIHVADLVEWTQDLLAAMARSKEAMDAKPTMAVVEWRDKYLTAGAWCTKTFCKAAGFCPALEKKALDAAGVWFDDIGQPRLTNRPEELDPDHAAQILDAADMIGDWINAVRAYWHAQAEAGVVIPNHILVPKIGRETWFDGREAEAAKIAIAAGLPNDKVFNDPKIKTPKQIRESLKKARLEGAAAQLEGMSGAESKGSNLVRIDKTSREAIKPAAHQFFDVLE